ncbi:MAG: integration host factor subunit beta [Prevotella sp.]|nr:integration host factor subunit beta [Prevotella sp.]
MTKADIINQIVDATGVGRKEVTAVVEGFMIAVKDSLIEKHENVYLRGFGSFNVKKRKAKTARNIKANTTIQIAAHEIPSFKPSKSFLQEMRGE